MTTTNEIPAGALYVEPAERITRPNDGETIETRLGRIEAWMRNEIFARTAMDEPDPDAGEDAKWVPVADAMRRDGAEGPVTAWDECASGTQAWFIALARAAAARAIDLGLAVSPDDPRLQPLDAEELIASVLKGEFYDDTSRDWELGFNRGMKRATRLIAKHLNAAREVER